MKRKRDSKRNEILNQRKEYKINHGKEKTRKIRITILIERT